MQYKAEDLAPYQKSVTITLPAATVDAALDSTINRYRSSVSVPGFRKGKVPAKMVEKQYQHSIYMESTFELIDKHVKEALEELKLEPVTKLDFANSGEALARGKDFSYGFSFYYVPEFDLPEYLGVDAEQPKVEVSDAEVDLLLENLRKRMATPVQVEAPRKPVDGDLALIDFSATDENGEPVPGLKAQNMQLVVGEGKALEAFDDLLRTITSGEEGEDKVTFPESFPDQRLAGKTVNLKIKLTALFDLKLPELNDEFAAQMGGDFANIEALREDVRGHMTKQRSTDARNAAQEALLEKLVEGVEIPLPAGMVERYTTFIIADIKERMNQTKQSFEAMGRTEEQLEKDAHDEAERFCRKQLFAMRVASKENIKVHDGEVDNYINAMARQMERDYQSVRDEYEQRDLVMPLKDRLLFDKVMNFIYAKANVKTKE